MTASGKNSPEAPARPFELLAPAGDFETALAAFESGADAVYCGLAEFSARAFAKNLTFPALGDLISVARARGRKVYVAFNTLLDEADVPRAVEALARLEETGPDALIVQDLGVARLCRRHFPSLRLHASTQLVAHNLEGVMALRRLGFSRAVLARELSLAEVSFIAARCGDMELECFVHGALCYSVSGLCLFSAMEKGRSGNRGRCAYCCRQDFGGGRPQFPFSMKDLRLGADAKRLVEAGVVSLKIEGRMKSALYVASVTRYYSQILRGAQGGEPTSVEDLETVFSRRTTKLHLDGLADDVIDSSSLGHLGAAIGSVKRVTKDRDGRSWLRFHTQRALEKHDGLQFAAPDGGKPFGFGIGEMRQAISRTNVFDVPAGTDVEILLPEATEGAPGWGFLRPGATVYCSMSNAVKRRFPVPSFRPGDYSGPVPVDVGVELSAGEIRATAQCRSASAACAVKGAFGPAKSPEKTRSAVEKAFSKLGETDYSLAALTLVDPDRLFAPMGSLNELRRALVARLDAAREEARREKVASALADSPSPIDRPPREKPLRTLKLRLGQKVPQGKWDELVVAVSHDVKDGELSSFCGRDGLPPVRLALPVFSPDPNFGRLRVMVKRLVREGFARWEASDLATLALLRSAGVSDITADWTLYAFNAQALAELAALGVRRFVASPENGRENLRFLVESGYAVECLAQQSTPLFISRTKPAAEKVDGLSIFPRDGLWITTRPVPRTFDVPASASSRIDLSWSET